MNAGMYMTIYNGRLDPDGERSDVYGNEVDNWGFEGPEFGGVTDIDFTYGTWTIKFDNEASRLAAKKLTGWSEGNLECSLEIWTVGDCIGVQNSERGRSEYFGDFTLQHEKNTNALRLFT